MLFPAAWDCRTAILRHIWCQHADGRWPFSTTLEIKELRTSSILVKSLCWRPTPGRYVARNYHSTTAVVRPACQPWEELASQQVPPELIRRGCASLKTLRQRATQIRSKIIDAYPDAHLMHNPTIYVTTINLFVLLSLKRSGDAQLPIFSDSTGGCASGYASPLDAQPTGLRSTRWTTDYSLVL